MKSLTTVTRIEMHLTTARLLRRKLHFVAERLENVHDGLASAGIETVIDAREKKGNFQFFVES
jgi:hypothetical protein